MKSTINKIILLIITFLMFGCNHSINLNQLGDFISNEENGLKKLKVVNDIVLSVKYITAEQLAFRELKHLKSFTQLDLDSVVKDYANQVSIVFSIKSLNNLESEFKFLNTKSISEYQQQLSVLNFQLKKMVSLKIQDKEYKVILSEIENYINYQPQKVFLLVFSPNDFTSEQLKEQDLTFFFKDELFKTGISKFTIYSNHIQEIPSIELIKN